MYVEPGDVQVGEITGLEELVGHEGGDSIGPSEENPTFSIDEGCSTAQFAIGVGIGIGNKLLMSDVILRDGFVGTDPDVSVFVFQ